MGGIRGFDQAAAGYQVNRGLRYKGFIFSLLFAIALGGYVNTWAAGASSSSASQQLASFIDGFVEPHEGAKRTDLSAASFAEELQQTKQSLARLRAIDIWSLSADEQIDWQFAQSILRGHEIDQQSVQSWRKDPRVYMKFTDVARTVAQPGNAQDKANELLPILDLIPAQLSNAQKNLEVYLPRFQELSLFMAQGAVAIFERDVPEFARSAGGKEKQILSSTQAASAALQSFIKFLKVDLTKKPKGDWAIGKETYNAMLKDQYLMYTTLTDCSLSPPRNSIARCVNSRRSHGRSIPRRRGSSLR